jgi:UDP-glucose 4-epimerase
MRSQRLHRLDHRALGCARRWLRGGDRGWIGDNPFIFLDREDSIAGWKPRSIDPPGHRPRSVLRENSWLMDERA